METALRELQEEAGLIPDRLYNLSRAEAFYRHSANEVVVIPAFAAVVAATAAVRIGAEHDAFVWLRPAEARVRISWPRVRREVDDAVELFGGGGAGVLDDVLRVGSDRPR